MSIVWPIAIVPTTNSFEPYDGASTSEDIQSYDRYCCSIYIRSMACPISLPSQARHVTHIVLIPPQDICRYAQWDNSALSGNINA